MTPTTTSAFRVDVGPDGRLMSVGLLDQRLLPHRVAWVTCSHPSQMAEAIRDMVVRGAPAIAIAAAYGMALTQTAGASRADARRLLAGSRPTAVNLAWALERLDGVPDDQLFAAARGLHEQDIRDNRALGDHGARLLKPGSRVYTHCNTGALATGGWGTALGVVRSAHIAFQGDLEVWVGETRPFLQGARLTAWELSREGIRCTLVTDGTAAALMAAGRVDAVIVGCDRVARNGDTANKIGTLGLAVSARHHGVAFFVAMPWATWDGDCATGADIPIEERAGSEVRGAQGVVWAAEVPVYNPAFDVTPADLITAWITEDGVIEQPFRPRITALSGLGSRRPG